MTRRVVLVHGAAGALGRAVIKRFRASKPWTIIGVDVVQPAGDVADHIIVLSLEHALRPTLQCRELFEKLDPLLGSRGPFLDAVITTSGGFAMGNAKDPALLESCEAMYASSVFSSFVAVHTAATFGKTGCLSVLPGAAAVSNSAGTPWGLAYGSCKSGVHHMVRSLGASSQSEAGMPQDSKVVGIAPVTLDTPGNREAMPGADTSNWTPLGHVAQQLFTCTSGVMYRIVTTSGETTFEPLEENIPRKRSCRAVER